MQKNRILIFCLFLFRPTLVLAEGTPPNLNHPNTVYAWVTGGFMSAVSLKNDYAGYAAALIPTIQYNQHVLTFRGLLSIDPWGNESYPTESIADVSLLYGRCFKDNTVFLSMAAGPSYVEGMERGEHIYDLTYEEKPFHTVGLSIDAQAFVITPILGLGVYGIVNFNEKQPYWSALLCISVGRILSFKPQK